MGLSIWQDRGFERQEDADVAVVGAGFSGAAVAWWLAREGLGVTVLDRAIPGSGASGQGPGRVLHGAALGDPVSREAASRGREALDAALAERDHRLALQRRPDGVWALDPRRLVELLLEDVVQRGGRVVPHQPVFGLAADASQVEVRAGGCTVHAESAVVCVGQGLSALLPEAAEGLVREEQRLWAASREGPVRRGEPPAAGDPPSHRWVRVRLLAADGLPVAREVAPRIRILAGLREEHWDLGFEAARRMALWVTEGPSAAR